jgi:sec-independent protein translocase protein TatC
VLDYLIRPYCASVPPGTDCRLSTIEPTESVATYFRVAVTLGAVIAMPLMLFQVWAFISPGLEARERRYVYVFVPGATVLFLTGVAFAWFIMLPTAIFFLSTFAATIFKTDWRSSEYIPFVTSMVFWIGVSFEMPLVFLVLARIGIVNARMLLEGWRYAVVGIAIVAAVITPTPDPFNMGLVMLPLIGLYAFSVLLAAIGGRRRNNAEQS